MDCLVFFGLCKCLFNQLLFDFWNSVNDGSYETVEVVALQFNQAVLGVVVNKKEMKIAWSFSGRVTERNISAVMLFGNFTYLFYSKVIEGGLEFSQVTPTQDETSALWPGS